MSTTRISHLCVALALCGVATPALADWTGKGNVGASFATGNSENQAASAALELKNTVDKWQHTFGFAGNYGSESGTTTAQRWEVRGQTQYALTERAYAFGAGRYDDDRFSQYDYQASLAGGLGYRIIDSERTKLWVQGGPGYRYAEILAHGRVGGWRHLPWRPGLRPPAHRHDQDRRPSPRGSRFGQHLRAERPRPRGHDLGRAWTCAWATRCVTTRTCCPASRRPTRSPRWACCTRRSNRPVTQCNRSRGGGTPRDHCVFG